MGPTGVDLEPVRTPDPTNSSIMIQPNVADLRAWKRHNTDALCAIVNSVTYSVLTLGQHTTKACDAWGILACQYETKNHTRIQNLENQLATEKLTKVEKVENFIKWIKDLQDQMVVIGVDKTLEDLSWKCI